MQRTTPTQMSLVQIAVALGLFGRDPKVLRVRLDYVSQLRMEAVVHASSNNKQVDSTELPKNCGSKLVGR